MISKKDLIVAVLATFCVMSLLFVTIPIRSAPADDEYDPWIDTNDDGIIDYEDLYNLASKFRTSGTPINKTDVLLELNTTVTDLLSRVEDLEEPVTGDRIADYAITNSKLGFGAIPYGVITATDYADTTAAGYENAEDMDDMSVQITVYRTSILLITFSAQAYVTGAAPTYLNIQALVDGEQAEPATTNLVLCTSSQAASHSFTFAKNVAAGTYTVKIQWWVSTGDHGYANERTLSVVALPRYLVFVPIIPPIIPPGP